MAKYAVFSASLGRKVYGSGLLRFITLACIPVAIWGVMVACDQTNLADEAEPGEELSGGQVTVFNRSVNAFGLPAPGLTRQEERLFGVGNSFFNQNWVQAPASTTARDGLGPYFNARSCAACHFKDGRGRPPEFDGERPTGYLVRVSVPGEQDAVGGPVGHERYGDQIQDNALLGLPAEATVRVNYVEEPGTFADGTPYSLRRPIVSFTDEAFGPIEGLALSPRVGNHMSGLGLLNAVPESDILALADPDDTDGDGISGRPNYVWNAEEGRATLGRFGWKANQPNVRQQVAGAFLGDIGITTPVFPDENCIAAVSPCDTTPNGGTPEIDPDDFEKVVLYSSTLAVPARRNWDDPTVLRGKALFREIGCASCHVPQLKTGISSVADALSNQTIRPYTDLLLHDMGERLADNREDFLASGSEWRTPPLWGIGLFETVNGHTFFLHDGRARNITEAILWHGGEGETARERFRQLSASERDALLQFLNSL